MSFCEAYQARFGATAVRPNAHIHMHLAEERLKYGPAPATWCFAFERMNFILGKLNTNGKNPEVQVTSRPNINSMNQAWANRFHCYGLVRLQKLLYR